jgi:periplasmic copper chaperone A
MKIHRCTLVMMACCLIGHAAFAADSKSSLAIEQAFARATPPGATSAGVFLVIDNRGETTDRLVGAASPVADEVAVHQMRMDGGVMKMTPAARVEIKPHATLRLDPGGYHVMLTGLHKPLRPGESFPLALTFEKAGRVEVSVVVGTIGAAVPSPISR